MSENVNFHADAAIVNRLGRELVAKQETALVELVKNAYDADATSVAVSFDGRGGLGAVLSIHDNGVGMSRDDIVNGFLRLASDLKVVEPKSPNYRRTRAGRKGIGRFSAQRLGNRLVLTTQVDGGPSAWQLVADWTQFKPGIRLDDVSVLLQEVPPTTSGTTLRIEGLNDDWSHSQIRSCWRSVLALQQPFPVKPTGDPGDDPGFTVEFRDGGGLFQDETVVANMQTEILDHLPVIIEMRVDDRGRASWRIAKNAFGELRAWRPIHHADRDNSDPPPYSSLRNVAMKAYHVILEPTLLPSLVFTRVRDILSREGGIRLYRNGFRVTPYGERDDDWLGLDEIYSRRNYLANFANRNFFGVVEVSDPEGVSFEEHTSREGLIETPAFGELRDLTSSVLITAATEIHADRGRKIKTNAPSPRPEVTIALSEARAAMRAAREAAEIVANSSPDPTPAKLLVESAAAAEKIIEQQELVMATEQRRVADADAMMRLLSSLGMTTAEFSHETGMAFEAFRLDLERVFDVAVSARQNDEKFLALASRARDALVRLDTLTGYLNATVASRALREIHPVSLSKAVEDFARGIRAHAETQSTKIEIETPPLDPLYTVPMHEAELASVLLNFHTNALKAMKRTSNERKILVAADRDTDDNKVRLRFCDSGDGVPIEMRERIFEAFVTRQSAPTSSAPDNEHAQGTGLGLWIVEQIATNAGGSVAVVDPPKGYSTCFELLLPEESDNG
ncbi:ATP-binding protein [Rhizobium laguerreae]|uniref:ATP-binding protein n=1 Tax=Rhizobium laguerreae TaxID=1076926 RepID=UPI001C90B1E3|nr:sensor histidine kinase [Rhizobium laguerreae]MBY3347703.1 sensor histidine kinase [Rhizobium laguerreae]MBY3354647.1 sensor histidine kinase [Rhizobium laguerreae]MBY3375711.1 sensor histidine kinase [Rhizobium laguerreae]MBY3430941.1 sensor histidine kinase [Rhizobium laguerreae]MBY3439588.1 sensor histidine kinase [Rhizobium laguerreae]